MTTNHDDLDQFKDLIEEVKAAGEVPEPSPLFWHHLSARVRVALADEPLPGPWWMLYWRPVLAVVGTVSLVALVVLRTSAPASSATPAAPIADVEVSEMWRLMEMASPKVEMESAREAGILPAPSATDDAIASLSPAEREALVRLLRKEMGVSE